MWLSLSGEHQVDRSSVGKPRRRKWRCEKNAAQRFSIEEHRRPRRVARHRAGGQNASALPRKRRWFDAALSIAQRGQRSFPWDVFTAPTCRSRGWGVVVTHDLRLFSLARKLKVWGIFINLPHRQIHDRVPLLPERLLYSLKYLSLPAILLRVTEKHPAFG
jgi:hypothetical protein